MREREWDTRVWTVELAIPQLRQGGYFPCLLEPRRRDGRALLAVVQEAYVHGVSTRNVDALAQAFAVNCISKECLREVSEHTGAWFALVWPEAKKMGKVEGHLLLEQGETEEAEQGARRVDRWAKDAGIRVVAPEKLDKWAAELAEDFAPVGSSRR